MSTILERLQYGFDRDSRRTWRRRALAMGEDNAYGYDGLSQVTQAALGNLNQNASAIGAVPAEAEAFDYDPTGNWRGYHVESDGSVTLDQHRIHDKGNRLTQISGDPYPVLLDRAGRMTQVSPDASGDWNDSQQIKWDAWGRITRVSRASDGAILGSYAYDGLTRRIKRTISTGTRHTYYSDQWQPLEERAGSESTAATQNYWGARHRDDLARRDHATTDGGAFDQVRYVLMDYFSPAAIIDEAGTVTERYRFSAFGQRTIMASDFSPRSISECDFEFAFQGQLLDAENGFANYGYRYYAPLLGRWLSKDPAVEDGGENLYAFLMNKPTGNVDYLGLLSGGDYTSVGYTAAQAAYTATISGTQQHNVYPEFCGLICECYCFSTTTCATAPHMGGVSVNEKGGWYGVCDPYAGGTACPSGCNLAGTYHAHGSGYAKPSTDDYNFPPPLGLGQFIGGARGSVTFHITGHAEGDFSWLPVSIATSIYC